MISQRRVPNRKQHPNNPTPTREPSAQHPAVSGVLESVAGGGRMQPNLIRRRVGVDTVATDRGPSRARDGFGGRRGSAAPDVVIENPVLNGPYNDPAGTFGSTATASPTRSSRVAAERVLRAGHSGARAGAGRQLTVQDDGPATLGNRTPDLRITRRERRAEGGRTWDTATVSVRTSADDGHARAGKCCVTCGNVGMAAGGRVTTGPLAAGRPAGGAGSAGSAGGDGEVDEPWRLG